MCHKRFPDPLSGGPGFFLTSRKLTAMKRNLYLLLLPFLIFGCSKREYRCDCSIRKDGKQINQQTYYYEERTLPDAKEKCNNNEPTNDPDLNKHCAVENPY